MGNLCLLWLRLRRCPRTVCLPPPLILPEEYGGLSDAATPASPTVNHHGIKHNTTTLRAVPALSSMRWKEYTPPPPGWLLCFFCLPGRFDQLPTPPTRCNLDMGGLVDDICLSPVFSMIVEVFSSPSRTKKSSLLSFLDSIFQCLHLY